MSEMLIIVNEAAGGGRARTAVAEPLQALRRQGLAIRVAVTTGPGHATQLAREAAEAGVERVVAAGGDGTVFEVVNGLVAVGDGAERRPMLGLLPVGTGNSFVRDLGLGQPEAAVDALVAGRTTPVDVVRLTHADGVLHYINLMSVGFSAEAGALTNRRYKGLGAMGYILAVLQSLVSLRAVAVPHACDDGPFDESPHTLVSFCNSRYTGGDMMMAPTARISDGELDVVRIGAMGRVRFLSSFPRIFAGTHPDMPEVTLGRAKRVRFRIDQPLNAMIDGEVMSLVLEELQVVPGALRVVT